MQTCNRTLFLLDRRSRKILKIHRQFRNIRLVRARYKDRPTSHDETLSHSTQYPNDQGKRKHSNSLEFSLSNDHKFCHINSDCATLRAHVTNVPLIIKSLRPSQNPSCYQTLLLFSRAFAIGRCTESEVRADRINDGPHRACAAGIIGAKRYFVHGNRSARAHPDRMHASG